MPAMLGGELFFQSVVTDPLFFFSVVFTVVVSIILHELAHGLTAIRLGDRTPIDTGHITLDPLVHMGPFSLVMLALVGIAWGQMLINPSKLRGRYGESLVAIAGPLSNLLLAGLALTALGLWLRIDPGALAPAPDEPVWANTAEFLYIFGSVNVALCLFNLLPVPPLDGSHVAANFSHGYARVVRDPGNAGLMMLAFVGVFFGARFIFQAAYRWSMAYIHWIAAAPGPGG